MKKVKKEMKSLGKLRDATVASCVPLPHYKARKMEVEKCILPRTPGSRLIIAERVFHLMSLIPQERELHPLRKKVRECLFLLESLGLRDARLKGVAKELGRLRDEQLRAELCLDERRELDVSPYREVAFQVMKELLSQTEFNHLKNKLK